MKVNLAPPAPWEATVACRDNPDAWFPSPGAISKGAAFGPLAICGTCPARRECLDKALALPADTAGIWGGTTGQQRRRIRAGRLTAEQAWVEQVDRPRQTPAQRDARLANMRVMHAARRALTACKAGHEFTEESTLVDVHGKRDCRTCRARRSREWRARRKQAS